MRLKTLAIIPLLAAIPSCGSSALFSRFDLPESPGIAEAPYPRLVDVPAAPAPGTSGTGVPDPAEGTAVIDALAPVTAAQAERARRLSAPVLSEEDRRRLGK